MVGEEEIGARHSDCKPYANFLLAIFKGVTIKKSPHRINCRGMKGRTIEWQSNDAFLSCRFQTMRTEVEHD